MSPTGFLTLAPVLVRSSHIQWSVLRSTRPDCCVLTCFRTRPDGVRDTLCHLPVARGIFLGLWKISAIHFPLPHSSGTARPYTLFRNVIFLEAQDTGTGPQQAPSLRAWRPARPATRMGALWRGGRVPGGRNHSSGGILCAVGRCLLGEARVVCPASASARAPSSLLGGWSPWSWPPGQVFSREGPPPVGVQGCRDHLRGVDPRIHRVHTPNSIKNKNNKKVCVFLKNEPRRHTSQVTDNPHVSWRVPPLAK